MGLTIHQHRSLAYIVRLLKQPSRRGIRLWEVCLLSFGLMFDSLGFSTILERPLLLFGLCCLVLGLPLSICGLWRFRQGWPIWQQRRTAREATMRKYRLLSA